MVLELLKKHPIQASIIIYVFIISAIVLAKPRLFFHPDGRLKEFGTAQYGRTIFPLWLFCIILAVVIYFLITMSGNIARIRLLKGGGPRFMQGGGGGLMPGGGDMIVEITPGSKM